MNFLFTLMACFTLLSQSALAGARFTDHPVILPAEANHKLVVNLRDLLSDEGTGELTWEIRSTTPEWVSVNLVTERLEANPTIAHLGDHSFDILVTDGTDSGDINSIRIHVYTNTVRQHEDHDPFLLPELQGRAETLWAIEHGSEIGTPGNPGAGPTAVAYVLKANMQYFFKKIKDAAVEVTAGILMTNGTFSKGKPIAGRNGSLLLRSTQADALNDFNYRVGRATFIGVHDSSPSYVLFDFLEKVPGMADLFQKGIMEPNVPLHLFVATSVTDFHKPLTRNTPIAHYEAEDFAKSFLDTALENQKPIQIVTVGPPDQKMVGGPPANAPRILAEVMGGKYHDLHDCNFKMRTVLESFADQVIESAKPSRSGRIALRSIPSSEASIVIRLGGVTLIGNTGAASDQWHYEISQNTVVLHWDIIDFATVKPGDKIEIDYEVQP